MKIKIILIFLIFFSFKTFAQNIKVYNHYSFSDHYSKKANVFQIEVGQILEYKKIANFRFIVSANYSFNSVKKNGLEQLNPSVGNAYTNDLKGFTRANITLPLAFEVDWRGFGVGVSQEIISLGFNNSLTMDANNSYFSKYPTNAVKLTPNTFSSVLSGSDKNNLATTCYLHYTFSDAFTIKAGLSRQKLLYNFTDSAKNKIELMGIKQVMPFVSLRFNIEK